MFSASKSKGASSGYQIANSLRFRSSASAYLNRTPAAAGNRQTWTWSGWVKRGSLGGNQGLFSVAGTTDATYFLASISSDTIYIGNYSTVILATTQVLRDPSAWYHLVIVLDTTQATANNRLKLYLNGTQITAFSNNNIATYYTQNSSQGINQAASHSIGRETQAGVYYLDGYLADINFIDGQALTPSSFGQINATTGVWQPIRYAGTYGTNGFKLNFSNGTSTTTLGYDSSGNGNNWTTNNISLTAGSTYDWMIDSPTPFQGSSYGVGNYAVLNPLIRSYNGNPTFSNANLTIAPNVGNYQTAFSTINVTSGKWYCEVLVTGTPNSANMIGASSLSEVAYIANNTSALVGITSSGYGYYIYNGNKYTNGTSTAYGSAVASGDVVSVALDLDAGKIWFAKNGTWQASGDPVAGTNAAFTGLVGSNGFSFGATVYSGGVSSFSFNFGQRPFVYTPPSDYKSLCTYNLPTPTIQNGAGYMAATTYTGTGATQTLSNAVNGVGFQPDMVWVKSRSAAQSNSLQDSVRGITLQLSSNLTAAEITSSGEVTALNATGFSLGGDVSGYGTNTAATTYVGWQWKGGGTAVSNTNGSITSQVSASALSGFSVVKYTGTGSAATVGHGLGVAPSMIIVKSRTNISPYGAWPVYHITQGNNKGCFLNTTAAVNNQPNLWNSTTPTSSVFSIGTDQETNYNTANYVAYCFAAIPGYSAFGSYTGNGSSDGPFNYCGFRPRYILVKRTDLAFEWWVDDTSRSTYNVSDTTLFPNNSNAEAGSGSGYMIDILSNGFKNRAGGGSTNASGGTYIYAAFCENPFQNSLAR